MPLMKPDREVTLSSPIDALAITGTVTLGVTVLWHPRPQRIGEQAVLFFARGVCELSRNTPEFFRAGSDIGEALEYRGLSRQPLRFLQRDDGGVGIVFPTSRMHCEIDGVAAAGSGDEHQIVLDAGRLQSGVVIRLGSNVLLCLGHVGLAPSAQHSAELVGVGAGIARVRSAIAQVASTDMPVLILGETGTGKELIAQAIHAASARSHQVMVSVNMATLGESLAAADLFGAAKGAYTGAHSARAGFFAEADGGTLFLDEIGDTPPTVQPMLLRALETGEYRPLGSARPARADVRLIAATDRDLSVQGFNQPLLRRLEAFVIAMPPLRDRREDIGVLILHFLQRWCDANTPLPVLPTSLVQALCLHDWPGNVRQLGHVLRRLVLVAASGEWPAVSELLPIPGRVEETQPMKLATSARYRSPRRVSDTEVLAALEASQWCVRRAAEQLSVSRPSLYALLESITLIRRADAIPVAEIEAVVQQAPDDPTHWASMLRTPRESLRRRVRALGLSAR